jgi:hypothetical protein
MLLHGKLLKPLIAPAAPLEETAGPTHPIPINDRYAGFRTAISCALLEPGTAP